MEIFLNGHPLKLYPGARIEHALLRLDESLYQKALQKKLEVRDQHGFVVEIHGALDPGFHYTTHEK